MIQGIIACIILATIFGGIALVVGVFFWGVKLTKGMGYGKNSEQQEEEARIIQEVYQGLSKMENRIEALETLLLDERRKETDNDSK